MQNVNVGATGVRGVWSRNNLESRTKRLLLELPGLRLDERLAAAAEANAAARATADCRRGIATFLTEKKTPDWRRP